jgi:hypothetical protein
VGIARTKRVLSVFFPDAQFIDHPIVREQVEDRAHLGTVFGREIDPAEGRHGVELQSIIGILDPK